MKKVKKKKAKSKMTKEKRNEVAVRRGINKIVRAHKKKNPPDTELRASKNGRIINVKGEKKQKTPKVEPVEVEKESRLSKKIGSIDPDLTPVYGAPWSPRLEKTKHGEPLKPSGFRQLKHKPKKEEK